MEYSINSLHLPLKVVLGTACLVSVVNWYFCRNYKLIYNAIRQSLVWHGWIWERLRCSGNYWRSPRLPVVVVTSQYPFPYPPSLKPPGSERLPGIWTGPASYQVYSRSLFVQPSTHFNKVLFLQFLESFMKRKCKDIFQSFQMTFLIDKAVQGRYLFLRPSITISLSNGHIFCSMTCPAMHIFQFYGWLTDLYRPCHWTGSFIDLHFVRCETLNQKIEI